MKVIQSFWDEKWADIDVEGVSKTKQYQISTYGRLRKFHKKENTWIEHRMSLVGGYPQAHFGTEKAYKLATNQKTKTLYLHRLVAEFFCDKTSEDQVYVIHLDFKKDNNFHINLKWVTYREWWRHWGKSPAPKGRKTRITPRAKLTETDVIRLKKLLKRSKMPLYKIAKRFGISHTQLNRIRSGENWGHIEVD